MPPAEVEAAARRPRAACAAASESVKLYALDDADTASEPKAEYKLPVRGDGEERGRARELRALDRVHPTARRRGGAADGRVAIFDVASGKVARTLEGHSMPVRDLVFSPDRRTLYTACDDGHAHAYDAHHGSLLDALPGHKSWVLAVPATSDGRGLVTVGADAKTKLWDIAQGSACRRRRSRGRRCGG